MGKTSIKRNAVYNSIKSILQFLFPLITYPYATRVLGATNLGKVSYGLSIISYFSLVAVFGVSSYAIKECAAIRDDRKAFDKKASELFSFSIITTVVAMVLLLLATLFIGKFRPYGVLLAIQSLQIVFTTLGVDWVNVVVDDYKYITLRSIVINILNIIILFAFVRDKSDYYVYAFLSVSTVVFVGLMNFVYIRKYVKLSLQITKNLKEHFRKILPFAINDFSIAIYVSADVTLIGWLKGDYYVGIYAVAVKIYTVVKSLFIAIYSVTLPSLTYHASRDDKKSFKEILSQTTSYFVLLGFPATTGLFLYAPQVVEFIGGEEYMEAVVSMRFLAIALLFAIFGGIITRCINIPLGYEKVNSKVSIFAAVENIVLNIPMIMLFYEKGAAFTTMLAEASVLLICFLVLVKEKVDLKGIANLRYVCQALGGCFWIVIVYFVILRFDIHYLLQLTIGIVLSVVGYVVILAICKNELMMEIIRRVTKNH